MNKNEDYKELSNNLTDEVVDLRLENEKLKLSNKEITEQLLIGVVSNAERTLNDFFDYLDELGDRFDSNSLEGHKREWLKSFNDC